jgi:glutathione S-transferase
VKHKTDPVYILGVGMVRGWADASSSLTDLIFASVSAALNDSGVDIKAINSVVLAAHDLVDGRSLSSMVTAPAAGAYLRDEIRLASDGLSALSLASARVEAGETEYTIVAAWGRESEGNYARTSRAGFDPIFEQAFRADEFTLSALRLSAWSARHGCPDDAREAAAAARRDRARNNPRASAEGRRPMLATPLFADDAPLMADIAVAAIIGRKAGPVRIAGFGHGTASPLIGARDLVGADALADAIRRATDQAGFGARDAQALFIDGATLSDEALALEVLGLAEAGQGYAAYAANAAINPGGGGESGWCYPTCGLVNAVEAYLQLTGRAGACQLPGKPSRALATGLSAMGGQAAYAAFLEAA